VKNLSGSRTYEEEQMMQQSQKTASFLNETKESEATECLKQQKQS